MTRCNAGGVTQDGVAKCSISILLVFLRGRSNSHGAHERSDTGWKPMLLSPRGVAPISINLHLFQVHAFHERATPDRAGAHHPYHAARTGHAGWRVPPSHQSLATSHPSLPTLRRLCRRVAASRDQTQET